MTPQKGEEPSEQSADVSDRHSVGILEFLISDRMNHGQVSIQTGENVEKRLSNKHDVHEIKPGQVHGWQLWGAVEQGVPQTPEELQDGQVEGEDVQVALRLGGALLPPPLLLAQVEDEDGEGEEEEEPDPSVGIGHGETERNVHTAGPEQVTRRLQVRQLCSHDQCDGRITWKILLT